MQAIEVRRQKWDGKKYQDTLQDDDFSLYLKVYFWSSSARQSLFEIMQTAGSNNSYWSKIVEEFQYGFNRKPQQV